MAAVTGAAVIAPIAVPIISPAPIGSTSSFVLPSGPTEYVRFLLPKISLTSFARVRSDSKSVSAPNATPAGPAIFPAVLLNPAKLAAEDNPANVDLP